jgi:DNA-binding NtrC family response regulator
VRVIAATNRDLAREIRESRFRQDLYYRLHVLRVHLPPLRSRLEDIPALAEHFLRLTPGRLGFASHVEIEEEALLDLCRYDWPGNVRELEAMLERLAAEVGDGGRITAEQVRGELSVALPGSASRGDIEYLAVLRAGETLADHLSRQELNLYDLVRSQAGGNHSETARRLGVERTALYHRIERARKKGISSPVGEARDSRGATSRHCGE